MLGWRSLQDNVGASLLAMTVCQPRMDRLTDRYRWQASSHRDIR